MNEILFRGKRLDTGEWAYGFAVIYEQYAYILVPTSYEANGVGIDSFPVDPESIGRYSGIIDKNGRKVFEGDIYAWVDKYGDYCACLICFGEFFEYDYINGFYVKSLLGDIFSFAGSEFSEIEISGNIHDNPELFKEHTSK